MCNVSIFCSFLEGISFVHVCSGFKVAKVDLSYSVMSPNYFGEPWFPFVFTQRITTFSAPGSKRKL